MISGDSFRLEHLNEAATEQFGGKFDRLTQIASDPVLVRDFWECFCIYRKKTYINNLKRTSASLSGGWLRLAINVMAKRDVGGFGLPSAI